MRIRFAANQACCLEERAFVLAGVAGEGHYLNFQRSLPIGSDEDWGIHVEFDDQINSGYEKTARCSLSPTSLQVEFSEPIGGKQEYAEAEIALRLAHSEWQLLVHGLGMVFVENERLLVIQE